jgi:hypothetical protein
MRVLTHHLPSWNTSSCCGFNNVVNRNKKACACLSIYAIYPPACSRLFHDISMRFDHRIYC